MSLHPPSSPAASRAPVSLDRAIGGLDAAVERLIDRSIDRTARTASPKRPAPLPALAAAGSRHPELRAKLRPFISEYEALAARADELLYRHVFADSEGLLGFVWDLFDGPVWDQARDAVAEMTIDERRVFLDLYALLGTVHRLAGDPGVDLLYAAYQDRYLTRPDDDLASATDTMRLSDALIGVLAGVRDFAPAATGHMPATRSRP